MAESKKSKRQLQIEIDLSRFEGQDLGAIVRQILAVAEDTFDKRLLLDEKGTDPRTLLDALQADPSTLVRRDPDKLLQ